MCIRDRFGSVLAYLWTRNVTRALSVLMVDFSCALKLAMPLAVLSAMREASSYHVTVKGGKYLEAVAKADTIVFDKTGTLTYACPVVSEVIPFGGHSEEAVSYTHLSTARQGIRNGYRYFGSGECGGHSGRSQGYQRAARCTGRDCGRYVHGKMCIRDRPKSHFLSSA